jgi:hypothetical protein
MLVPPSGLKRNTNMKAAWSRLKTLLTFNGLHEIWSRKTEHFQIIAVGTSNVEVEVEFEVNLWPTVSQPVCPGVRHPSGTCDQFFFRHEISFRQLWLWYFVAPSLTRGRVCNLLLNCFWALPEQSLLSQSPAEITVHILLPHLRLHQPGGPGSRIYIPRNRVAQLYPRALG